MQSDNYVGWIHQFYTISTLVYEKYKLNNTKKVIKNLININFNII